MSKEKTTAATEETTKEVKGIFHKLYGATKEALEERKKTIVEKSLKSKFDDFIRNVEKDIISKEEKMMNMTNFETYNVSEVVTLRMDIEIAKKQQEYAKNLFSDMFNETYNG